MRFKTLHRKAFGVRTSNWPYNVDAAAGCAIQTHFATPVDFRPQTWGLTPYGLRVLLTCGLAEAHPSLLDVAKLLRGAGG